MREKLKYLIANDQIFYGILLVLVGLGSFGLGRMSIVERESVERVRFIQPVVLENKPLANPSVSSPDESGVGELIASKTGTKYHRKDCPGAKQIKPANIITFNSAAAALAAGYTPAANCPGL